MASKRLGTILVVDDHYNWCQLLREILEYDGHQVATARCSEEARALLSASRFDVAVLDMRLVADVFDVGGMILLQEIKNLYPSMKAIILTGFPDPDQRAKAIEFYGADGYYEKAPDGKPFDIDQFSDLINRLLKNQNL